MSLKRHALQWGSVAYLSRTFELVVCNMPVCKPIDSTFLCGYAITSLANCMWEAHSLPFKSAQVAELVDHTCAYTCIEDKPVTIYTDSCYAFVMQCS